MEEEPLYSDIVKVTNDAFAKSIERNILNKIFDVLEQGTNERIIQIPDIAISNLGIIEYANKKILIQKLNKIITPIITSYDDKKIYLYIKKRVKKSWFQQYLEDRIHDNIDTGRRNSKINNKIVDSVSETLNRMYTNIIDSSKKQDLINWVKFKDIYTSFVSLSIFNFTHFNLYLGSEQFLKNELLGMDLISHQEINFIKYYFNYNFTTDIDTFYNNLISTDRENESSFQVDIMKFIVNNILKGETDAEFNDPSDPKYNFNNPTSDHKKQNDRIKKILKYIKIKGSDGNYHSVTNFTLDNIGKVSLKKQTEEKQIEWQDELQQLREAQQQLEVHQQPENQQQQKQKIQKIQDLKIFNELLNTINNITGGFRSKVINAMGGTPELSKEQFIYLHKNNYFYLEWKNNILKFLDNQKIELNVQLNPWDQKSVNVKVDDVDNATLINKSLPKSVNEAFPDVPGITHEMLEQKTLQVDKNDFIIFPTGQITFSKITLTGLHKNKDNGNNEFTIIDDINSVNTDINNINSNIDSYMSYMYDFYPDYYTKGIRYYTYINLIEGFEDVAYNSIITTSDNTDKIDIQLNTFSIGGKLKYWFDENDMSKFTNSNYIVKNINIVLKLIDNIILSNIGLEKPNIMIHCSTANNRSPAMLAFYLYTISDLPFDKIYKIIEVYSLYTVALIEALTQGIGLKSLQINPDNRITAMVSYMGNKIFNEMLLCCKNQFTIKYNEPNFSLNVRKYKPQELLIFNIIPLTDQDGKQINNKDDLVVKIKADKKNFSYNNVDNSKFFNYFITMCFKYFNSNNQIKDVDNIRFYKYFFDIDNIKHPVDLPAPLPAAAPEAQIPAVALDQDLAAAIAASLAEQIPSSSPSVPDPSISKSEKELRQNTIQKYNERKESSSTTYVLMIEEGQFLSIDKFEYWLDLNDNSDLLIFNQLYDMVPLALKINESKIANKIDELSNELYDIKKVLTFYKFLITNVPNDLRLKTIQKYNERKKGNIEQLKLLIIWGQKLTIQNVEYWLDLNEGSDLLTFNKLYDEVPSEKKTDENKAAVEIDILSNTLEEYLKYKQEAAITILRAINSDADVSGVVPDLPAIPPVVSSPPAQVVGGNNVAIFSDLDDTLIMDFRPLMIEPSKLMDYENDGLSIMQFNSEFEKVTDTFYTKNTTIDFLANIIQQCDFYVISYGPNTEAFKALFDIVRKKALKTPTISETMLNEKIESIKKQADEPFPNFGIKHYYKHEHIPVSEQFDDDTEDPITRTYKRGRAKKERILKIIKENKALGKDYNKLIFIDDTILYKDAISEIEGIKFFEVNGNMFNYFKDKPIWKKIPDPVYIQFNANWTENLSKEEIKTEFKDNKYLEDDDIKGILEYISV